MAELPSGTVTFLFTDIEGSTRDARRRGRAMDAHAATTFAVERVRSGAASHEASAAQ